MTFPKLLIYRLLVFVRRIKFGLTKILHIFLALLKLKITKASLSSHTFFTSLAFTGGVVANSHINQKPK
ncbi:MAG TPA: hypothetical protein DCS87_01560 [Rheinheimera sp.]|nr:hypothetical protein [Rheinheimera sp.]